MKKMLGLAPIVIYYLHSFQVLWFNSCLVDLHKCSVYSPELLTYHNQNVDF